MDISELTIPSYYKKVSCFIQLLRSCMNENGFEFVTGIVPIEVPKYISKNDDLVLNHLDEIEYKIKNLFTQKKDQEVICHFSNLFIQTYLPLKCNVFPSQLAILIY